MFQTPRSHKPGSGRMTPTIGAIHFPFLPRRVEYRERCRTVMRLAPARPHCALATWPQMKAAEGTRSQAGAAGHVTVPTRSPADWQSTPSPARRTTQRAAYPVAVASESSPPRYMHKVWTWTVRSWPKLLSSSRAPRRLAVPRGRPCQVVHPGGPFPSSKNNPELVVRHRMDRWRGPHNRDSR